MATSSRSDYLRREMGAAPRRSEEGADRGATSGTAMPADAGARRLIVGSEITLSGEIHACDQLIIQGTVEARVPDGKRVEISETGLFKGTADIHEADIAGAFEGELVCRGRLTLRATGRISGDISYGELEIEAGGQIDGNIQAREPDPVPEPVATTTPEKPEIALVEDPATVKEAINAAEPAESESADEVAAETDDSEAAKAEDEPASRRKTASMF